MPCLACSANLGQVSIWMEAYFFCLFFKKLYFECIALCKLDQEYVFWDILLYIYILLYQPGDTLSCEHITKNFKGKKHPSLAFCTMTCTGLLLFKTLVTDSRDWTWEINISIWKSCVPVHSNEHWSILLEFPWHIVWHIVCLTLSLVNKVHS